MRLAAWTHDAQARAFVWGEWDCCLAPSSWVLAVLGVDPMAEFRGTYTSAEQAYRRLRDFAGGGVPEAMRKMAALHRFPEIAPPRLQRGDVAMIVTDLGPTLGVCLGSVIGSPAQPNGLAQTPIGRAIAAWRI